MDRVRMEQRLLNVLQTLAHHKDLSLALEGKSAHLKETMPMISKLKEVYGLVCGAESTERRSA